MEELFQHSVFRTTPSTLLGISKCIASRDMDIFHILYHCKAAAAALKNEGEQRQKSAHNCLAKRKLADRLFFPCPSLLTLFLLVFVASFLDTTQAVLLPCRNCNFSTSHNALIFQLEENNSNFFRTSITLAFLE